MKRLVVLLLLAFVACESQEPPAPCGPIPQVTVNAGETAAATACFDDPNGDTLVYSATSSNQGVATASISGATITITAIAPGNASVTVTASDPGGLKADQILQVMVPNRAPQPTDTMPSITVPVDQAETVDASSYFAEPDGETLTYSATSSNTAAATVTVAGATVAVTAVAKGATNVMVTATDPGGLAATQTFEVTVPNRAPVAGDPIPSQTLKVGRAVTLDVTDYFTDPDGDELTYSVDSSRPSVATATMSGSTLTVVAVAAGTATMTVTATDPGDLSATQSFRATVSTGESFDLEMAFTSSVSSTVRSHVADARDEWEAVLEDTGLDDVTIDETRSCLGISRFVGTVDDHLIFVHVDSIDGEGGILAYAGYCYRRLADDSPLLSATWIDEADVERMLDLDALVPVMFHELAHALGFSGRHWDRLDLLDEGDDPHFEGKLAIEAFDEAGGDDYDGEKVPVQLWVYSHWRENVFQDEIMTPSINLENDEVPISAITLQSMADIGYEVDVSRADDYELPDPAVPPPGALAKGDRAVFDLGNDVVWGPVTVLDADGRVIRVIPPPPGSVRWPPPGREVRIELPARAPQSGSTPPRSGRRSK